jgi:WD40 repeat protein
MNKIKQFLLFFFFSFYKSKYKVIVYNTEGMCLNKFQPQKWSLGVKVVNWSPSGQLLAVGGYDQKVGLTE